VAIKLMHRHCGTIPVVEGDARLNGMVTALTSVVQPSLRFAANTADPGEILGSQITTDFDAGL